MGAYGGIVDFDSALSFMLSGFSGPTGRPVSLLTFLLDASTFPSDPYSFKRTNLLIHLLVGCFVYLTSNRILLVLNFSVNRAIWVSMLGAAIWLLHPLFVSTTLYIIQRMAQLSTLFVMIGLFSYFWARSFISTRPLFAHLLMSVAVVLGTVLAVFSKENGVLLPLLILVVEWVVRPHTDSVAPKRLWYWSFIVLPSVAILAYLISNIDFTPDVWLARNFDQPERLLTQTRVIWDYIGRLFIPVVEGNGLFQDGYVISRGLLAPGSTLIAIVGLCALLAVGFYARMRYPLVSLAILFFLAGHLIESSVLGLEIYFEHRNYLPAVFVFLPFSASLVMSERRFGISVAAVSVLGVLALLSTMTFHRATLWGDSEKLQMHWALTSTNSPRAANAIAEVLLKRGRIDESIQHLEASLLRMPDSALLNIRLLVHKVAAGRVQSSDFDKCAAALINVPFDAQAVEALGLLADVVLQTRSSREVRDDLLKIIAVLDQHARYQKFTQYRRYSAYVQGRVYLSKGDARSALQWFIKSARLYNDVDAALRMVSELAMGGYYDEALSMLSEARDIFREQPKKTLKRSELIYSYELDRLEKTIHDDLASVERTR